MSFLSRVAVDLGPRSYEVLIASGLLPRIGELLRVKGFKQTNAFVITNAQVGGHYFGTLREVLTGAGFTRIERHDIPASEEGKNWDVFSGTCAALLDAFPDA